MLHLRFDPFPVIQTARLTLRQITASDVREVFFLRSDKGVLTFLQRDPAKSMEEASEFIKNINHSIKNNEAIMWAISVKPQEKLVGTICLWNIVPEHQRAEIGFVIHPDQQGKGFMQEAVEKVIDYGFDTMKLHSIEANVDPSNIASIRLIERNHFVREAYFKENLYYDGKFFDSAIYSLLRERSFGMKEG